MSVETLYVNTKYKSKSKRRNAETRSLPIFSDDAEAEGISEQKGVDLKKSDEEDSFFSESCSDLTGISQKPKAEILNPVAQNNGDAQPPDLEADDHTRIINGIVLEYLEHLGLKETCILFRTECLAKEVPLPSSSKNRFESSPASSDIDAFFVAFDAWDAEELTEIWSKFCDAEEARGSSKLRQSSILLKIYVASLPFRKNADAEVKGKALEELRQFHQLYSEEFTKDPVCLPLFAFPFVENPDAHPAFKVIFTDQWQQDLRQQLQTLLSELNAELDASIPSSSSIPYLQEMYQYFLTPEESRIVQKKDEENSGREAKGDASSLRRLRPEICSYVKRSLTATQERYCKLLHSTTAVVNALELAFQRKAVNIFELDGVLRKSFPELFGGNKEDKPIVQEKEEGDAEILKVGDPATPVLADPKTETDKNVSLETTVDEEWTDEEFSDVDTDAGDAGDSDSSAPPNPESKPPSKFGSTTSTPKVRRLSASARSSAAASHKGVSARSSKRRKRSEVISEGGDTTPLIPLKLTDSKANMRIMKNAEELAQNEDQEIPEEFSRYFSGFTPRLKQATEPLTPKPNLEPEIEIVPPPPHVPPPPPSLLVRFPTPPKTYTVARGENLQGLYIPSSLEVGLGSNSNTGRKSARSRSSSKGQGQQPQDDKKVSPTASHCASPRSETEAKDPEAAARNRKRWEAEPLRISPHILPQRQHSHTQLILATRLLTPPPDKHSNTLGSIISNSNPPSPATSSPSQEHRKTQNAASIKRLQTLVETGKRPVPAVGTGPPYVRQKAQRSTPPVPPGHVKGQGQGYTSSRLYKINPKGPPAGQ